MSKRNDDERLAEGASLLRTLIDWEGEDLKRIYEPFSDQVAYIFTVVLFFVFGYLAWKKLREWREKSKIDHIPYKVIKPPSTVVTDQGKKNKRICAVVGGTGFVGSHIVNELVRRGEYYVFVLGRTFRPERTNPKADCLIQVDLLDFDGLTNAFEGVDSVIDAAAILPTVFTDADELWRKNKIGQENVLHAAKKTGVKNIVFLSAMPSKQKPKSRELKALLNIFSRFDENFIKENGKDGLHTCVVAPGNIVGLNSPFFDVLTSGKMTSSPMSDILPVSFSPVEYVAKSLVSAESKLATDTDQVGGKIHLLRGDVMSWRQFLSLSGWPKKISETPQWVMALLLKVNVFCATVFGWAPFGADLTPALMEIFSFAEEDRPESEFQCTYDVLEIGPPKPSMDQYVREMVERYQQKNKLNKEKNKD